MSVKFKVGFTIPAETLFSIVAKFLPIEDLHVEEIMERPEIKPQLKVAKLIAQVPKVKRKSIARFVHPSGKRVQDFVIEYLEHKPSKEGRWNEMGLYIEKQGFHPSSINNGIARLIKSKVITKIGPGMYRLEKKTT